MAGSYGARVSTAVVQYNTKGHAGSEFHKTHSVNTEKLCLKVENSRIRHYRENEIARQAKPRKRACKDKTPKAYISDNQRLDLSGHSFDVAKNIVLEKFRTDQENREEILANTYGQKLNSNWLEARKKFLNCSFFGRIINSRSPKSYTKVLSEMLYSESEFGNTAEQCHQRLYEKEALKMFTLVHNRFQLEKTGIYIDKEMHFLGLLHLFDTFHLNTQFSYYSSCITSKTVWY